MRRVVRPLLVPIGLVLVSLLAAGCGNRGFPGSYRDFRGDETEEEDDGSEGGTIGTIGTSGSSGSSGTSGSSGATTGSSTGSGQQDTGAAQTCVDRINAYRSSLGLPAYARWSREESCADDQAASDSQSGQAHGAFSQCGEWAQNECPGWPGPAGEMIVECLEAMWSEGPGGGHYDAMSSTEYTSVACGFHATGSGDVWAVQDFK